MKNTDAALVALYEAGTLGIEESAERLLAWFPPEADLTQLAQLARELDGEIRSIEAEDWTVEWRKHVRAVRVGSIFVAPPWLAQNAPHDLLTIVIEPDRAFGTGDHATTRGCLAMLARHVKKGDRVLDIGCGSGVLGIAAAKLGAGEVFAVDCDPVAVAIAEKNAEINGAKITSLASDHPPAGKFNVIVANIQSSVLEKLLPALRAILSKGGTLILSGILSSEGFSAAGMKGFLSEGEWLTMEIRNED